MRRRPSALAALAGLALAGCGSGGSRPAAGSPATAVPPGTTSARQARTTAAATAGQATLCGQLRARLEGIEHIAAMNDPQPGALKGHLPVARVERASGEAVEVSRGYVLKLREAQAPGAAKRAVRRAERGYRRLERKLRRKGSFDASGGLRAQFAFERIAAEAVRGCLARG